MRPKEGNEKPNTPADIDSSSEVETGQVVYTRKTYWQKLSIVDKKRPNRMLDIFIGPFKGFTYPCIVYAGLMYGANALVWSGVQNATTGTVYTTRYGFSTSGVAAAYSAGIIGAIIGYVGVDVVTCYATLMIHLQNSGYYCGKMGRVLTLRLARRRGGISEPEDTLYMFIASMILVPFAMLLYGLGVTYHVYVCSCVGSRYLRIALTFIQRQALVRFGFLSRSTCHLQLSLRRGWSGICHQLVQRVERRHGYHSHPHSKHPQLCGQLWASVLQYHPAYNVDRFANTSR